MKIEEAFKVVGSYPIYDIGDKVTLINYGLCYDPIWYWHEVNIPLSRFFGREAFGWTEDDGLIYTVEQIFITKTGKYRYMYLIKCKLGYIIAGANAIKICDCGACKRRQKYREKTHKFNVKEIKNV